MNLSTLKILSPVFSKFLHFEVISDRGTLQLAQNEPMTDTTLSNFINVYRHS